MNYILFSGGARETLQPFTFTRPVADIRVGILTIREKWELLLNTTISTDSADYLKEKFPCILEDSNVYINGTVIPSEDLVDMIKELQENQAVFCGDVLIAYCASGNLEPDFDTYDIVPYPYTNLLMITHPWDIFSKNHEAIQRDFAWITQGRDSQPIPEGVFVENPSQVFIEEGATLRFCSLNAADGPIYIGKNAEVMEGSHIRGPFALCEGATVKMGAKIYTGTTIGPYSKVGGEVNNSVIFGYSNKGHDGFLGNSVLGEWCNLGADTNTSNLKNNYAEVRLWNYATESFTSTGLQFCGLMMGDHSKCGINTMFNTGTVVGVSANIFGSGFPRNFIPSFSWGGSKGMTTYKTQKAIEVAKIVMARRNMQFTDVDGRILEHLFEETRKWRRD